MDIASLLNPLKVSQPPKASHPLKVSQPLKASKKKRCSACHQLFANPSNLKRHHRFVHENRRPHKCSICRSAFHQSNGLRLHKSRIHGQHREFACTKCNSFFSKRNKLTVHCRQAHASVIGGRLRPSITLATSRDDGNRYDSGLLPPPSLSWTQTPRKDVGSDSSSLHTAQLF